MKFILKLLFIALQAVSVLSFNVPSLPKPLLKKITEPYHYLKKILQPRTLEDISSSKITIDYLQDSIQKLFTKRSDEFKEFKAKKIDDSLIEIYHGEETLSFEVMLETQGEDKKLIITNTDEKKYIEFADKHARFARTIAKTDQEEKIEDFILESFVEMKKLLAIESPLIEQLVKHQLVPFLSDLGYNIFLRQRKFKPSYEISEILDVNAENGKKYIEIVVFNVDKFFLGIQLISLNKILEIKIPKKNIEDGFQKIKPSIQSICVNVKGKTEDDLKQIFGLNFDDKQKVILESLVKACPGLEPGTNFLKYPGPAFRTDLTQLNCSLGQTKIFVEEINNSYLQYLYIVVNNEFFKAGYVISPLTPDFTQTIEKIIQETQTEIQEIQNLKKNEENKAEPASFENISNQIKEAAKAASLNVECGEQANERINCTLDSQPIVLIQKITISNSGFFKVQFFRKPNIGFKSVKIINDLKIPIDNGFNLHQRLFPVAKEFFETSKAEIQIFQNYQFFII